MAMVIFFILYLIYIIWISNNDAKDREKLGDSGQQIGKNHRIHIFFMLSHFYLKLLCYICPRE